MIDHEHCIDRPHSDIHIGGERKAEMHVGAMFVMLFMIVVAIVRGVSHKLDCVVVINGVTVGMLLVGHMRSLSHSDHQGVIDYEQKCHEEFRVHAIDLSYQWAGTVALCWKPGQTGFATPLSQTNSLESGVCSDLASRMI